MEHIVCKNLSFSYPLSGTKALDGINIEIGRGEFVVLCGKSGCGKTTLLRHLKNAVAPSGEKTGEIFIGGLPSDKLSPRDAAEKVGFVMQNPESQIVTDKVWHELAFGLENLGYDKGSIRRKTAEMASYFGMQSWYNQKVSELSGGRKQLLNLASVMAMNPEILLLDEPTSQLDPIAASNFISTVSKINRELGITVIMTEHRLEEAFAFADRVLVMDGGKIIADCSPEELCARAEEFGEFVRLSLPSPVRIFSSLGEKSCPVTVNGAAKKLSEMFENPRYTRTDIPKKEKGETVLRVKNVSFRYSKNAQDVLVNLCMDVPEGAIYAVMGGNGAGKSTLLRLLAGISKPYAGKISFRNKGAKTAMLPQNVQLLFTKKTVLAEIEETGSREKALDIAQRLGLSELLERHPYDVSGGEQQRVALAKLLLTQPDIILLDEPTKGMDSEFKSFFANLLKELCKEGRTVIMVSHDIEFCAGCADFCSVLFDGEISGESDANSFFAGNFFYTTAANRLSRHIFENCVTDKDVTELCRKNLQHPQE